MPDEVTPSAPAEPAPAPTPEAPEAVPAPAPVETPAPAAPEPPKAPEKSKLEAALETLRNAPGKKDRDPLVEEERDPLAIEEDGAPDPMGDEPEVAPVAPEEEAAPVEPTPPEPEAAPAAPIEPSEEEKAFEGRKRFNINRKNPDGSYVYSDRWRAILQLSGDEGIEPDAAEKRLYGGPQMAAPAAPTEVVPEVKPPTVAEMETQRKALQVERKKEENFYLAEKNADLTEQIEELTLKIAEAKAEDRFAREHRQTAEQSFESGVSASMAKAEGIYPDAGKVGSILNTAIVDELKLLAGAAIFNQADWPEAIAERVAKRLGIAPKAADAAAAAPTAASAAKPVAKPAAAPAAPKVRAVPLLGGGGVSGVVADPAKTLSAEIAAARAKQDLPQLNILFRQAEQLARRTA